MGEVEIYSLHQGCYQHTFKNTRFHRLLSGKEPARMQEVRESWVQSLAQEGPLEKEMAPHSSTLLQHPCLENPMDRGAWWAMVHGITKTGVTGHN